jgi:CheY-like chemotaxis protein
MLEVILVIEDEPGIVDFERGLQAHGFEVRSALDGVSGTDKAVSEPVDLVVLDMMLPGRGGLEVLAASRTNDPTGGDSRINFTATGNPGRGEFTAALGRDPIGCRRRRLPRKRSPNRTTVMSGRWIPVTVGEPAWSSLLADFQPG